MESQVIVWCDGKEGSREAWGRQFESQVMQVCIFRQKWYLKTIELVVVAGCLEYFDTTGLVVVAGCLEF